MVRRNPAGCGLLIAIIKTILITDICKILNKHNRNKLVYTHGECVHD